MSVRGLFLEFGDVGLDGGGLGWAVPEADDRLGLKVGGILRYLDEYGDLLPLISTVLRTSVRLFIDSDCRFYFKFKIFCC